MKKRLFIFITLMFVSTTCVLAQSKELVESSSKTKLYQSPSTGSSIVTGDFQFLFKTVFNDNVLPPPFTQRVLERQNGWLKLPMGWVQENDVKKTEKEPITAEMLEKTYMGNFGKYEETGDTVYFGLQVIVPEENNGDAFVIVYLPDTRLFCMAKRHDDMIETTHGIMVKFAEYEADRTELAFQLYRERDGVKLFNLYYGERWNTRRIEKIIDETMTIDSFDTNKLTKDDWETLKKAIIKDGKPCQNYITAGMLKNLSPTDQF